MYIHTSDWSGSRSEEGPLFEGTPPRSLYVCETLDRRDGKIKEGTHARREGFTVGAM